MIENGLSVEEIVKNGKFPGRTHEAIRMQIKRLTGSFVEQKKNFIVGQIREAEIVGLESIVKRYVDAFNKICDLTQYDKQDLERFRIIFMAAWKYRALFADYERLKQVESEIAELRRAVEEIKAQLTRPAEAD
jgi:hypothetical protein